MMTRKSGLGRGLDALIPGDERPALGGVVWVSVAQIIPNPRQPRSRFDNEELDELAASIREHGVIQPLLVTLDTTNPEQFILIAGERRWLAARQAGLEMVPAIVREATDQQRLELALIENVQRADLGPLETAEAYRQLAEDFQISHEEIAARVYKSRSTVTNTLRLLKLPADVQASLAGKQISEGHGRALLALATQSAQSAALQTIIRLDLNVRQTEELVKRLSGEKLAKISPARLSPELSELEERLRSRLGTKVRLANHGKQGTITIHYYSDEELTALVGHLLGGDQE
jgi:ParB family transcriptional regulator, chromosome partitioning protein